MTKSYELTSTHLFVMTDYEHLKIAEIIDGAASEELVKFANKGALITNHFQEMNTLIKDILSARQLRDHTNMKTVIDKTNRLGEIINLLEVIPDLKPCPFCGGEGVFAKNGHSTFTEAIMCEKCLAESDSFETKKEAAVAWNNRI